jgi:hypothetical protein
MSLQVAAQHLASKGRDGDSTLVHMSPGEVKGLQALAMAHGGSLSINPDTGLVEANFLKRLLPMIAGAALTGFSGGMINPLTASMIVGGFEGVRTGDLGKGLMAGLGAYGGAGLTSGLSTAGAQTGAAGTTTATQAANASANATPFATGATQNMGANAIKEAYGVQTLATPISAPPINMGAEALKAGITPPVTMGNVGAGFSAGPSAIYKALPTGTLPAFATTAASAMTPEPEMPGTPEEDERYKGSPYRYNLASNFAGSSPTRPNPYYIPTGLGYAAQGGSTADIMMAAGGSYDDEPMGDDVGMASGGIAGYTTGGKLNKKTMTPREVKIRSGIFEDTNPNTANLGAAEAAEYYTKTAAKRSKVPYAKMPKTNMESLGDIEVGPVKRAAMGGSIGGYSDGGRMLKGPGDGMSDSIPGVIGKRQPARLADGEFVVPADVVSHLGNGSTDAGAKRLYAMMDKVRKARTGNKKQGKKIKPEKYMPA